MPGILDHLLALVLTVALPIYASRAFTRFQRRVQSGRPGVRLREYMLTMAHQWCLLAAVLLMWLLRDRPLDELGLRVPAGWGFWVGFALAASVLVAMARYLHILSHDEESRELAMGEIRPLLALIPHERGEMIGFTCLSLTAGVCEELLYRGFLLWYLAAYSSVPLAALVSSVLFGVAHLYQGVKGIQKTTVVGLVMAGLFLLTGSIWVPMGLHALIDVIQGRFAYGLVRRR